MQSVFSIYAVACLAGYLCGATPWAFIIGKMNGLDIRKHGSGNPGATNVTRVLGKKWGVLCFFMDFLKGLVPVAGTAWLVSDYPPVAVCAGAAAVVGHMWPVFLKFKGGKGVSTTAGALAALAPLSLVAAGAVWAVVFFAFRYVSLASILAAIVLPVSAFAFDASGIYTLHPATLATLTAISALSILKHAGNIKRLLNGTENRFGGSKNGKSE